MIQKSFSNKKKLYFYFFLLTVFLLLGALCGCWLAEPMTVGMRVASARSLQALVRDSLHGVLPWLLPAVLFPAAIYLASRLRWGAVLTAVVVWGKGLCFGYAFALLEFLGQRDLLALFILRELALLAALFWLCGKLFPLRAGYSTKGSV